ncbi:hypothetical protein [Vibrio hepatarius]|uniref:hypothetical protein n=1 Tax=Vibrio hepatarius TaxID=171383 RepID=UPI001C08B3AB|nr:hypothetical protein [Vibrio hepatarius]MBU2898964.1 hypothetical protein [Vibrio hepatarius]
MNDLNELKRWVEIVQRSAIPSDGDQLTTNEKEALAQCCRILAQTAQLIADKVAA